MPQRTLAFKLKAIFPAHVDFWARDYNQLIYLFDRLLQCLLQSIKMAAPLAECTNEEQRAVIQFFCSGDVSRAKVHRRFLAQYRNSA